MEKEKTYLENVIVSSNPDKEELIDRLRNAIKENKTKYRWNFYDLGDGIIAKRSETSCLIKNEYNINKFLYKNGISVPEPFMLIEKDNLFKRLFPNWIKNYFLIRRDIPGERLDNVLGTSFQEIALDKYYKEIDKVRSLGINQRDDGLINSIFNPEEQKVYLIDFEYCEKRF